MKVYNDANGNTLTGGGRTNTWDSPNRLIQCVNGGTTSTFVYGADGLRRRSTVNNTTTDFVLDNSMFIRERRNGNKVATYLMGARGPEYCRDDNTGNVRWYLYDGLGSVLGEVDPNGIITSSRKFDVYGMVRGGNNPGGSSSHKFVGSLGHPSEDNTGLVYMRARYYDPSLGRFASQDPAMDGMNWFAYCSNDPVNSVDSNGRESENFWQSFVEWLGNMMCVTALGIIARSVSYFRSLLAVFQLGRQYFATGLSFLNTPVAASFGFPLMTEGFGYMSFAGSGMISCAMSIAAGITMLYLGMMMIGDSDVLGAILKDTFDKDGMLRLPRPW